MHWLVAIHISVALFAVVSVLDKHLVARMFPSTATFNVVFALLQFVIAPTFLIAVAFTVGFDGGSGIPWAMASGVTWGVGLALFFAGLRTVEVSRAAPIQAAAPVFAAVLAVSLFGDTLSVLQSGAILVVVVGAGLVTARMDGWVPKVPQGRGLILLAASSVVMGIAFVVSDEAVDRLNAWGVQGFRALFMGLTVLAIAWRPSIHQEVVATLRRGRAMGVMIIAEGILGPLAALSLTVALSQGSVSVVSAVASSRPLLVLLISIALSTKAWNVLNEPLDRQTIGLKVASTVLIVGGVVTLALA